MPVQGHEMRAFWLRDSRMTAHELYSKGYDVAIASYEFVEANSRDMNALPSKLDEYVDGGHHGEAPIRPTSALHSEFWKQAGLPFKRVILDEAQKVNKHDGARHVATKNLYCKAYVALSGTLMHNKWHDISGLLDFVDSHPFASWSTFMHAFSEIDYTGKVVLAPTKVALLQRFLQPFLIARPSSLIQLKELKQRRVPFKLQNREARSVTALMGEYHKAMAASKASGKKAKTDGIDSSIAGFGLLVRAQLASLHPLFGEAMTRLKERANEAYDPDTGDPDDDYEAAVEQEQKRMPRTEWLEMIEDCPDLREWSGRLTAIMDLYDDLRKAYPDRKIVLFSQYLRFQDIVAECFLRHAGVKALRYDGITTEEQRRMVRKEFRSCGPEIPLLMTSGAGSVGLNITEASIIIQLEPWWNGNNEKQAIARAYRQGQEHEVLALILLGKNSEIDVTILKTRDNKALVIGDVMKPLIRDLHQGPADIKPLKVPGAHPFKFDFPAEDMET